MSKKSIIKKQKLKQKTKKQNALKKIKKEEEAPILSRNFISLKSSPSGQGKESFNIDSENNSYVPTTLRHNKKKTQLMEAELKQALASKFEATKFMQGSDIVEEGNPQKSQQESVDKEVKTKSKKPKVNNSNNQDAEKHITKHHLEESFNSEEPAKKKSKVRTHGEVAEQIKTPVVEDEGDMPVQDATEKIEAAKSTQKMKKVKPEPHYTIFVGNLSYSTTKEDLEQFFSKKVPVLKSVRLPTDKETGKPRGIAFVEVDGEKNYQAALSLDKSFLNDRRINVEYTCAGSKNGKHRRGKITAKNLKFKDLKRRGIMTPGVRPPPTKFKFKPLKK